MRSLVAPMLAGLLAGCSYLGTAESVDPRELTREAGWIVVPGVPLVLQQDDRDCGAAALSMVLSYWRVPTTIGDVTAGSPPPGGSGHKAGELRDYARGRGLDAYLIHGTPRDLQHELKRGRPLIAGLVKRHVSGPVTHYEVVVALHPERGLVATLDPSRGWQKNCLDGFREEWGPSGFLTLVVLPREGPASEAKGGSP